MISIFKAIGPPGSITFFALLCLIGLALIFIWPRNPRLGLKWLLLAVGLYLILALPVVANSIAHALPQVSRMDTNPQPAVNLIFLLDGDNAVGRAMAAQQLHAGSPSSTVWVLGRSWIVDALVDWGIPRDRIKYEGAAADTRSQLALVQKLLAQTEETRTALVASRLHMPRVAGLAQKSGLRSVLLPSRLDAEPPTRGIGLVLPSYTALRLSRDAIYEHAALAFYQWQGWIELPKRN